MLSLPTSINSQFRGKIVRIHKHVLQVCCMCICSVHETILMTSVCRLLELRVREGDMYAHVEKCSYM